MTRIVVLLGLVASSSSCTLLWLFNEDPNQLPCDVSNNPRGECLQGYVCVSADHGDGTAPQLLCVKAGFKKEGDPCAKTEECSADLVCSTFYNDCSGAAPDDINCNLITEGDKGLACRKTCDPANTTATCALDQRCFEEPDGDFCQNGTCGGDGDCNATPGDPPALCSGVEQQGGKTGLCFLACNPDNCANGTCSDCKTLSGAVDNSKQCLPVSDPNASLADLRIICDDIGTAKNFEACGGDNGLCEFGSFCNLTNVGPICTPWCNVTTHDCDQPHQCNPIANNSDLGFCN